MKSIAIWYSPINGYQTPQTNVELHFNFWKIPEANRYLKFLGKHEKFLDIGIKIEETTHIDTINIYFPSSVKQTDFEDIVSKFIGKADLVSAIFNEDYKVTSNATTKNFEIKNSSNAFVFNVYKTSTNDFDFQESTHNGTIIKIKITQQVGKTYYRFRIKGDFIDSISTISKPTNSILQSAFSEIEMIDFRVNEIRDLSLDLLEEMNRGIKLHIEKHHFFFICSNKEEVVGSHQPYLNCRNLENYRWNDYIGLSSGSKDNVYLAYHWKEKDKSSVATLIKTKHEKSNIPIIIKYSITAFIIAVLIELFANWLYDVLTGVLTLNCNCN